MRKRTFAMMAAALSLGLAQEAQQGWEVTGTVTYDSRPVKGAFVIINGPSSSPLVTTDGQGRYSVKGVVPGLYSVRVQKEDNTSELPPRSLSLTGGLRLKADFRIPKGAVLSGRVLDRDKQPVPGVIVLAMSKSVRQGNFQLREAHFQEQGGDRTNDLGEYRIPYLPDGVYVIAATGKELPLRKKASGSVRSPQKGYPLVTFYPGTRVLDAAATLEIHSGEERPGLDIVIQKEATRCISFKVGGVFATPPNSSKTSSDMLLEERFGAFIALPSLAGGEIAENGSYEICGLAPGEYRLHFSSDVDEPVLHVVSALSTGAIVDKEDVDLGSLQLVGPGELRGTVSVKDAKPGDSIPAGMRIRLVSPELRIYSFDTPPGTVQVDGTFDMPRVFMDDYVVRVAGLPAGYYVIRADQQGRIVSDGGLRPGSGDLQITLGADGPAVSGRVLATDDSAIPDATVLLVPKGSGKPLVGQSDQTGTYRFTSGVQPGEYRLVAASDLMEWQRQDAATVTRLAANGVDLSLGPKESRTLDLKVQPPR
ncbi:MAG: carboxypeptidase-like regulatory domain-containing protein [Bryobacteraceae bacterium]